MKSDEIIQEWIYLNDALLMAVQINVFHSFVVPRNDKARVPFSMQTSVLGDVFDIFSNFSREYLITHLAKTIDLDGRTISIQGFFKSLDIDKSEIEYKCYTRWKKETCEIRDIIREARNKFSSHSDKESFHTQQSFGVYIEDVDSFLEKTLELFDSLYENNEELKNGFDKIIGLGLTNKPRPSQLAKKRRVSMERKMLELMPLKNSN